MALFVVAIVACFNAVPYVLAGTIRHDVSDSLYTALAAQPEYAAVGNLSGFGGTLISSRWVLTAAHVSGAPTFTPEGGVPINVAQAINYPGNTNPGTGGVDLALLRLDTPITSVTPAVRYAGSTITGMIGTAVGYGITGTGLTGANQPGGTKRAGTNMLDVLGGSAGIGGVNNNYVVSDFDNPLNSGDNHWGSSSAPLSLEYQLATGDSGGGMFVNVGGVAQLAGVNIFVASGGVTSTGSGFDYGDMSGFVRVSLTNDWIDDTIAAKWTNASGGSAHTAANWQIGNAAATLLPDSTDILGFNIAGTYSVNFTGANSYNKILVRKGNITLDLGGATQSATSLMQNGSVTVGRDNADSANLTLTNGTLTATDAFIGRSAGSSGAVELTSGAIWNLSESLYLSGSKDTAGGSGTLTVNNGTSVAVSGKLKMWSANAVVNIDGGTVTVGALDFVAGAIITNGSGSLTANGAGSKWSGGTIFSGIAVNIGSTGSLSIENGGTKTINGGTLNNAGAITLISTSTGITGGNGAIINNLATGLFDIQSNVALLFNSSGATPTFYNAGIFRKSISGGTSNVNWAFNNTGAVEVQSGGTLNFNAGYTQTAGRLTLNAGIFSAAAPVTIIGGKVEGLGLINADMQVAGTVSPGISIGQLIFTEDLVLQSSSSLVMDLGGLNAATTYDLVTVAGSLQVGGVLEVSFVNGFESTIGAGDIFTIINGASAITGSFTNAPNNSRFLTADGLGSFKVHYGGLSSFAPDDLVLTDYIAYIPGDFDLDGDVDGADFAVWANNFPISGGAGATTGDADGDGDVDGADFIAWQTHFSTPPPPGVAPVPEPTGWFLGIFSLGATLAMRSLRRHP